jgi:hypothetical protein
MFCTVRASSKVYSFDAGKCRQARLELATRALPHVNEWILTIATTLLISGISYLKEAQLSFGRVDGRTQIVGNWE